MGRRDRPGGPGADARPGPGLLRARGAPGGVASRLAGSLILGLLTLGGRALARRRPARRAPDSRRFSIEPLPGPPAFEAGPAGELPEARRRVRALEQELATLRERVRQLEARETR